MDPTLLTVGVLAAVVLVALLIFLGRKVLQIDRQQKEAARAEVDARRERIVATPVSPIGSLTPGVRKVKGVVQPCDAPLQSPLTKRDCVYYRFRVFERVRRSTGSSSSHRSYIALEYVIDDHQGASCVIGDATGEVEVALAEALNVLETDQHLRSGTFNDAPPELEHTLKERYDTSSRGLVFNRDMVYAESVLEPGDEVWALGTLERSPEGERLIAADDTLVVSDLGEEETLKKLDLHFQMKDLSGRGFY